MVKEAGEWTFANEKQVGNSKEHCPLGRRSIGNLGKQSPSLMRTS